MPPDRAAATVARNRARAVFQKLPMIPAMKAAIAAKSGDAGWATVRAPLVELDDAERAQLMGKLDQVGFTIPNAQALARDF